MTWFFCCSMKLYWDWIFLWKLEPILGNSKVSGTSLVSNLWAIFFLKTTSSSSILGFIYRSLSVGQNPQKALHLIFPCLDFSSSPKMSFRSCWRMSCLYRSCCFSICLFLRDCCCDLRLLLWAFILALFWGCYFILSSSRTSCLTYCLLPPRFCGGSWDLFNWY